MSDMNEEGVSNAQIEAQQLQSGSATGRAFGGADGLAQSRARATADLSKKLEEDSWAKERAAERTERYDQQNIVNRQTAIHAALSLEPKPADAEALVMAAAPILAFLTAKT